MNGNFPECREWILSFVKRNNFRPTKLWINKGLYQEMLDFALQVQAEAGNWPELKHPTVPQALTFMGIPVYPR